MKKSFLLSALLSAAIYLPVFAHPSLSIQHWQTSQGTPVYFVQAPGLPMVDIAVVFHAGSAYDGQLSGVAAFTNSMLNQGANHWSAGQIAEQFAEVGAQYSAGVTRDRATIELRSLTLPAYLNKAVETINAVIAAPDFPTNALARVRQQTLAALAHQAQNPSAIAGNSLMRALYGDAPYGHNALGGQASVQTITQDQLITFYRRYYVAKNAVIAIVGDLDRTQAVLLSNRVIAKLPVGAEASSLPAAPALTQSVSQKINFPIKQTHILVGQIGIRRQSPDYFPLIVGNYVLGGGELDSRLFYEVRQKRGLAYDVSSQFVPGTTQGPFVISLQTHDQEAAQALGVAKTTLQQFIQQGPTAAELQLAKKNMVEGFPLTIATNGDILSQLISIAFYQLPMNYLDTYTKQVEAVTPAEIRASFQKQFAGNHWATVMVGDQ